MSVAQLLPSSHLVQALYSDQYEPIRLRASSPNTRRLYNITLRSFAKWLGRRPVVADLNDRTVSKYLLALHDAGLSPYTVAKQRWNILALWTWAAKKGLLANWPDVQPEKLPERAPQAWSRADMDRLFAALRAVPGKVGNASAAEWWVGLHLVLWDTGERISAILSTPWANLRDGYLLVDAESRKGGRRDRLYPLAADTLAALEKLPRTKPMIFHWPHCRVYLWNRYKQILRRAGLPTDRKSMFHRMRRSVASHAAAAGLNATELMDHADARTTRAYIDLRVCPKPHVATHLFRPG